MTEVMEINLSIMTGDDPGYRCGTCRYAGPCFVQCDCKKIECRRNHPGSSGFPIMEVGSWCWDGSKSKWLIKSEQD